MKKIFLLIALVSLGWISSHAQWKTDDKAFTIVGADSVYGQGQMKALRTADGYTVLTWLNTPEGMHYDDPRYGYYLYMQTFDKNGNALLGKNGLTVSSLPTKSWTTDYGMQVTADGNIFLSYTDVRNDTAKKKGENYLYCYTPQGQPVWSKEGIRMFGASKPQHPDYEDMVPLVCVSGSNIYASIAHMENYKVKADSTNWQPSPWYPDEEMPDSIDMQSNVYLVMRYNADGTKAWAEPVELEADGMFAYPGADGKLYLVYPNKSLGLSARLIDTDGKDVWAAPVVIETSSYVGSNAPATEPNVASDGKGGLVLAYRKLTNFAGYLVTNHLTADGQVFAEEFLPNGTKDGNCSGIKLGVNGSKAFVAWSYTGVDTSANLWVNQLDIEGDYTWEGDSLLGYSYCSNDGFGVTPVKVIPQSDGWVMLYGDCTGWNTANFYVAKVDFEGNTLWKRQIAENDFKSSGFAVVNDDTQACIFYTCDKEYGDDWEEIPGKGGLRMMCVDISGTATGIHGIHAATAGTKAVYNLQGSRVASMEVSGVYIVKENGITRKVMKK